MINIKNSNNRKIALLLVAVISLVLVANLIFSFTINAVDLTPINATTVNDLVCTWNITGSYTQINVTWYNNSVEYTTKVGVSGSSDTLSSSLTKRDNVWNCTVRVSNSTILDVLSDKLTILNADPYPPDINNQTLYEDQLWSHTFTSTDPDGDSVTYICLPGDILDQCTSGGYLEWTPDQSYVGLHNFSFVAFDFPQSGSSVTIVSFNVTAVNDKPFFSPALSDQTMNENETLQYIITVDDEENSSGPFTFSMISSYNPERLEYTTSNDKNFTIRFIANDKAQFGDVGNYSVNVTACDPVNSSLCVNGTFNLEVITINHPPVFYPIQNKSATQGWSFNLSVNASDIEIGDTINFDVLTRNCSLPNPWNITTLNNSHNATAIINITILNNSHVACRNITITATDGKDSSSYLLDINLTNVNDPPIIYNLSYYFGNTQNNTDIRNLTAYTNTPFLYKVNGSDPDLFTYESEVIIYGDNSSLCVDCPLLNLNTTSGIISFTPNVSHVGNHTYLINLTDDDNLITEQTMYLIVVNNTPPYFNPALENKTANETELFTYDVNATDPQNDTITYSDNTPLFDISQTGLINFTPSCNNISNHTITLTLTDALGASSEDNFTLEIIHKPNAPVLPTVYNRTILEEKPFYMDIGSSTIDDDLNCPVTENLTFSSSFLSGATLFTINNVTGEISFTPNDTSQGNYLIQINVSDYYNFYDTLLWNLTISNRTNPPVIHNITPYGYPTVFDWIQLSVLGANITTLNATENMTFNYNQVSTDPDGDPLVYDWKVDGVTVGTSSSLTYKWDFSSSGIRNLTLTVSDNISGALDHNIKFTWNMSIANLNRPPAINDSLPNVTINGTKNIGNYLTGIGWGEIRFYDPDGDSLSYTYTNTTKVTIQVSGDSVTFEAVETGNDSVIFTASDGQYSVDSNNVTLFIIDVQNEEEQQQQQQQSSSQSTEIVPFSVIQEVEKEKEIYFDIIVPEKLTLYKNDTIRQPIRLVNNGNSTLRGVYVSATTNSTDTELLFSTTYFPEIAPGDEAKTDLIITAYKLLNQYEIFVWANVTEPNYRDKAIIYVNAIEKSRGNQSVTSTKITFAQDLLSSNPECLELNEFLKQALEYMDKQDYLKASQITDSVIQGCKYLVSQTKLKDERPTGLIIGFDLDKIPYIKPILLVFILLMSFAVFMTIKARRENQGLTEQ